jgi:two-component system, OmpR family, alkaline phosphatase synthesis response regulator PhoP
MKRILIVEDNPDLAYGLRNNLEIEGYEVEVTADGTKGLARARLAVPDLVVLDLMLPSLDGFRVLRGLREGGGEMPVLVLTARGEETDKVRALKLGADDYVTKPFGLLELLARVEALLRRARPRKTPAPLPIYRLGDLEIDTDAHLVRRGGGVVDLAPKEFELLLALARRGGSVVSRLELMREVWGYADSVVTRTIDTHVAELRRKLEDIVAERRYIITVRKVGYRARGAEVTRASPDESRRRHTRG